MSTNQTYDKNRPELPDFVPRRTGKREGKLSYLNQLDTHAVMRIHRLREVLETRHTYIRRNHSMVATEWQGER